MFKVSRVARSIRAAGSSALSLIELLAALAVATLLAALLLPAIGNLRESSMQAACASNLREIGSMIHTYAVENNGRIVHYSDTSLPWPQRLQFSVMNMPGNQLGYHRLFYCPKLVSAGYGGNSTHPPSIWSNYVVNARVMGNGGAFPTRRMMEFENHSKIPVMWDAAVHHSLGPPNRLSVGSDAWPTYITAGNPDCRFGFPHGAPRGTPGRGGATNILFLDGHVAPVADPGDGNRVPIRKSDNTLWD